MVAVRQSTNESDARIPGSERSCPASGPILTHTFEVLAPTSRAAVVMQHSLHMISNEARHSRGRLPTNQEVVIDDAAATRAMNASGRSEPTVATKTYRPCLLCKQFSPKRMMRLMKQADRQTDRP
jgi:hypothetical protein